MNMYEFLQPGADSFDTANKKPRAAAGPGTDRFDRSKAKQFSGQTAPGGSRRKPAFACFTQRGGHRVADALHGDDDLVGRNGARDAGKRQLGGGEGVGDAGRIAFDAGDFHQSCDGVADKPKHIFQRDGDSVLGHLGRASRQLHKRGGRHC